MRLWRHLLFALSSAWQSFWRNAAVSMAAVLSITLILVLAGVFLLLGHALQGVLRSYEQRVSVISISVADETPLTTVYEFIDQLRADPRVVGARYVSKEEELARFSSDPRNQQLVQQIQGNPVAAKIEVQVRELKYVAAIDTMARQWRGADRTDPTDYQGDFIAQVLRLSAWLTLAGLAALGMLLVVSIVIVMNTIRTAVYHRRHEIEVMKLVGATEWFVRGPFVIEGIMTGLVSAAVAVGLLLLIYRPFVERFRADLFFVPLYYDPRYVAILGQEILLAGALLGALGSYIGVRRFVRL